MLFINRLLLSFFFLTFSFVLAQSSPLPGSLSIGLQKNTSSNIFLVATDAENDPITFAIASQPANGTVSLTGSYVVYTPTTDYVGTDSFTFTASDGSLTSSATTVSLTVFNSYLPSPKKMGERKIGEFDNDYLGRSVAINYNGSLVAAGAPEYDTEAYSEGVLYSYQWINEDWMPIGAPIVGQNQYTYTGKEIGLSGDGTVLATKIDNDLHVFEKIDNQWVQRGSKIDQDNIYNIVLSYDGSMLVFQSNYYVVQTYRYLNGEYVKQGESISIESDSKIDLSPDGSTLVFGEQNNDDVKLDSGRIKIYRRIDNSWELEKTVEGSNREDKLGGSVKLNADGTVVVYGVPGYDTEGNTDNVGAVFVYRRTIVDSNVSWDKVGTEIIGTRSDGYYGNRTAIDASGTIIVIGDPNDNSSGGWNRGKVVVYKNKNNSWSLIASIEETIDGARFGETFEISENGARMIVGTPGHDGSKGGFDVFDLVDYDNNSPSPLVSAFSTTKNVSATFTLSGSDPENDLITFSLTTNPSHGTMVLSDRQVTYTPELDFIGSDSFGFSVSDGTNVSSETIVPIEVYMRYINNPVAMENSLLGKNSNDQFGKSVDFDANGVTMAVGAPFNDDSFNNAGQVVVYDYDNDQWTQKGSAINGLGENYYFGYNVKLSSDGTSLLVQEGEQGNCCSTSYISVYRFINDDWVKLGSTITKNDYYTMENIALSDDGYKIIIGSSIFNYNDANNNYLSNVGKVNVYSYDGSDWGQLGNEIKGLVNYERFGFNVAITPDANTIAVSSPEYSGTVNSSGKVNVYTLQDNSWIAIGGSIEGSSENSYLGRKIQLSDDGKTIVSSQESNGHSAEVYHLVDGQWVKLGNSISSLDSNNNNLQIVSIEINTEGSLIGVGYPYAGANSDGSIKLYSLIEDQWEPLVILNGDSNDNLGNSFSLTKDGLRVSAGISNNFDFPNGKVKIFSLPQYMNSVPEAFPIIGATTKNTSLNLYLLGQDPDRTAVTFSIDTAPASGSVTISGTLAVYEPNADFIGEDFFTYYSDDNIGVSNSVSVKINVYNSFLEMQNLSTTFEGIDLNDMTGMGVASNKDGSIVAIGSPKAEGTNSDVGSVRIYRVIDSVWEQIGETIFGQNNNGEFGHSVDLNYEGDTVVIGAPGDNQVFVYKNTDGSWEQVGQSLSGNWNSKFGYAVETDYSGDIIAISAIEKSIPTYREGEVTIYQLVDSTWKQIGNALTGSNFDQQFGKSISLNSLGTILAVGSPLYGNNDQGLVNVYEFNGSSWTEINQSINGNNDFDNFGSSLELNSDGSIIAIGVSGGYGSVDDSGFVSVYKNNNDQWRQMGENINGEQTDDQFGNSISINDNGSIVAVGVPKKDTDVIDEGQVKIFDFDGSEWNQLGNSINGSEILESFGNTVSLSRDGSHLFVGTPNAKVNEAIKGNLKVYKLLTNSSLLAVSDTLSTTSNVMVTGTLSATGSTGAISYSLVSTPTHGTATISGSTVSYLSSLDYVGTDSFSFIASSGSVISDSANIDIIVSPGINNAPVAISQAVTVTEQVESIIVLVATDLESDTLIYSISQPKYGTALLVSNTVLYSSISDTATFDSFNFMVSDGFLNSEFATVSITINPVNDPPEAESFSVDNIVEGIPTSIELIGSDLDNTELTFSIASGPSKGLIVLDGSTVTYTSSPTITSTDQFTYTVSDGSLTSSPATVVLGILGVNDAPVAEQINVTVNEQETIEITLEALDPDSSNITFTITQPANGIAVLDGNKVSYTSTSDVAIEDVFTYTAFDGSLYSQPALILISITPVNDIPIAENIQVDLEGPNSITIELKATDKDEDDLLFEIIQEPQEGTIELNGALVTYNGNSKEDSTITFEYVAKDASSSSESAQVIIYYTYNSDKDPEVVDTIPTAEEIVAYNYMTPNGDGVNDEFRIQDLELFPNNTLYIFNSQGIEVYRQMNYGQNNQFFDGTSKVYNDYLPNGTYFYIFEFISDENISSVKKGFIQILR